MMAADVHVRLSITAFSLISLAVLVGSEGSLFTSDDPLVILNTENFYKLVPRSQNAWFIDFYSSWCGHCIRFAPTWKELGNDISGWNGVLQVAAVDCAQEENLALCRDFSIEAYPTLKFINAFSDKSDRGLTFDGGRKTEELKHAVIDFLQNITDEGHRPPHLPHLHALRYMEDMWGDVTSSIRHTAVVFEESGSYLGRELLLDFSSRTDLMIRRMTKEHVAKFGVREFPSLFLIEREGTFKKIAEHKDREGFRKALNAVLGVKADKDRSDDQANALQPGLEKPGADHRGAVHLADLESGLHYSLRQEVAGHKDISGQKLEALKAYLSVLAKYFPGSEQTVNYLKLVAAWIEQQKGPLTGATWLKNINQKQSEEALLPAVTEWVACKGSASKFRGYPCSLWTIFHTLTVNAVLDAGQMEDYDPLEVLTAMRGYIKHFFGCRDCSEHFMKMAISIEKEVHAANDAILWLWRAHNKANLRLHGDVTEDPEHPKIQFPSSDFCPACHTLHRGKDVFDETQVLIFLQKFFSRSEIVQKDGLKESQKQSGKLARKSDLLKFALERVERNNQKVVLIREKIRHDFDTEGVEGRVGRLRAAELETRTGGRISHVYTEWGLNSVDISMCVLFYIVCSGILILFYFHLSHNHRIQLAKYIKMPC